MANLAEVRLRVLKETISATICPMPSGMHTDLFSAANAFLSTAQKHEPGFGGSLGPWKELDQLDDAYAAYAKAHPGVATKDPLSRAVRRVLSSSQSYEPGFGGMMGEWRELDALGRLLERIEQASLKPDRASPEI